MPFSLRTMQRVLPTALAVVMIAGTARAQDPLADAKELYASAAYDEALAALKMARDRGGPDVGRLADEYTAFCLLALGRRDEAEAAAESAIRANPLLPLDSADVSPRVDELFQQVRKRTLPELIRTEYRTARDVMSRNDTSQTIPELLRVRQMLDMAGKIGVWDETLSDISTLVDGFLDLNRAKVTELQARAAAAAPPTPAAGAAPVASSAARPAAAPPARTIFSTSDTNVTPPVAIRQDIPEVTLDSPTRASRRAGVLAVTIDEKGNVQDVAMRETISLAVDAQLVKAARLWQYRPALNNGVPVRYLKLIRISIDK